MTLDDILLIGSPKDSIVLQTSKGSRIRNERRLAVDPYSRAELAEVVRQHRGWEVRRPVCPTYNCAGMVWASRRTGIYQLPDYQLIRNDDGYRDTSMVDLQAGDLAVYRSGLSGDINHVGVILQLRPTNPTELWLDKFHPRQDHVPYVLSKLGDSGDEVMHHYYDWPHVEVHRVEFWTERPML